jgi:hypothetical protein
MEDRDPSDRDQQQTEIATRFPLAKGSAQVNSEDVVPWQKLTPRENLEDPNEHSE